MDFFTVLYLILGFLLVLLVSKKSDKRFVVCSFTYMFIIYTCRDGSLLPDLDVYKEYYETIGKFDFFHKVGLLRFEPGWYILNYLLHLISPDFTCLVIFYASAISAIHTWAISKYSYNKPLSLLLAVTGCVLSIFVMRQYLAVAVCMLSIPYVIERKPFPFFIVTLIAFSLHSITILWSIMYFLYGFKYNGWKSMLLFGIGLVLLTSITTYIGDLTLYFSKLENYIAEDISSRNSWKALVLSTISIAIVSYYFIRNKALMTGTSKLFYIMQIVAFLIALVNQLGTQFTAFYRVNGLFGWSTLFTIPTAISLEKDKGIKAILIVYFVTVSAYSMYSTAIAQGGLILNI